MQAPKELPEITAQTQPPMLPKEEKSMQLEQPQPKPFQASTQEQPKKEFKLPKIERSPVQERSHSPLHEDTSVQEDDMKEFEEAINKINIDMVHSETPETYSSSKEEETEYYKPAELGEGYFSEIEHYIKNKDVNEIIDDVMKKDFLTSMKDYHGARAQGKPFYLHQQDLKYKLEKKMEQLRSLEEEWHSLKAQIEEKEKKRIEIEQRIEQESQELKELFRQIKVNQILEQQSPKEHYFKLRNGQELKNLNDLRKVLEYMSDEDFNHHVNQEKNDFAIWIREALQNKALYEKIKDTKTREELQEILKNPL
ncbi:hypothetical protein AYK26_03900 [Euryarchaeota archaeon SM23-78]|nr:MAG: hypothetical protein AYK26_03900 [Euryarchaeota archaeon SM23-78]